jgi:hypothetical protein
MKTVLILMFFFTLLSLAQVVDTSKFTNPSLDEGQCHAIADTKVYLKDINAGTIAPATITDIGLDKISSIANSSEESYFFCKLKCQLNNKIHFVWNTQKDKNENFKNMQGFVCLGLEIANVQATPTLVITTTIANPFEAVNSKSMDLRNYLKHLNYKIPESIQKKYLTSFFDSINVVAKSYSQSGHPELIKAAETLYQFKSTDLSDKNSPLKLRISELAAQNWTKNIPYTEYLKNENLVDRFLIDNARFIEFLVAL